MDRLTGLPELPDNRFWRVTREERALQHKQPLAFPYQWVELKLSVILMEERHVLFGLLAGKPSRIDQEFADEESAASITVAAKKIMARVSRREDAFSFEGDYPPKRLNTENDRKGKADE